MLTKPKKFGGANLKSARDMNWSLFAKMAWWVLTKKGEVWCDVLKVKYGVQEDDDAHFKGKSRESRI